MGLTRSSFKKKIIIFGVAVFTALALTATGFATWVLSTEVNKEAEGNVTVGVTNESKIGISEVTFTDNIKNIKFEPKENDTSGRVRWNGTDAENLSVEFSVDITNIEVVANINVTVAIPDSVKAAADANYIVLPAWATGGIHIVNGMNSTSGDGWSYTVVDKPADDGQGTGSTVKVGVLTCKLEFGWGSAFGGMNPSVYFDDDATGKEVADDEVKVKLDTFRAVVYGYTYEDYMSREESWKEALTLPKYVVTINASA